MTSTLVKKDEGVQEAHEENPNVLYLFVREGVQKSETFDDVV